MLANIYQNIEFPLPFNDLTCLVGTKDNTLVPFYESSYNWPSFDFESNQVFRGPAELSITSREYPCYQIVMESGMELNLIETQKVFTRTSGWKEVRYLQKNEEILGPTFDHYWLDLEFDPQEEFLHFLDTLVIRNVVLSGQYSLVIEFLINCWKVLGRLCKQKNAVILQFDNLLGKGAKTDLKYSIKKIQFLLQKLGISSRIDNSSNLVVYSNLNINLFLYYLQVTPLLIDVPSPRKWELVTSHKRINNYQSYYLYNTTLKNVIVNGVLLQISYET